MRKSFLSWAMPGIIFSVSFAFAACSEAVTNGGSPAPCASGSGGSSSSASASGGSGGGTDLDAGDDGGATDPATQGDFTAGGENNTFNHFNDPGASGQKDPFEILKERAAEGPPEIRTRLHSCSKIPYSSLGAFLASRGVDLNKTAANGKPPTAGELYMNGGDALGVARYDAREGETYFHTTAGATKLFDIFVQAAPEMIANIASAPACQVNGGGFPMFSPVDGSCVEQSLTCIMGRPATSDDLILCNLMLNQANKADPADVDLKRVITVAAFLSAAHSCE